MNIGDVPFKLIFYGVNSPGAAEIGSVQRSDEMSFDDCIKVNACFIISTSFAKLNSFVTVNNLDSFN